MFRKIITIIFLFIIIPLHVTADTIPQTERSTVIQSSSESSVQQIDAVFNQAIVQNYNQTGMQLMHDSLQLGLQAVEKYPENYDVLWRCARSAVEYAEIAKTIQTEDWKQICRTWGKKGMDICTKAQTLEPDKIEGYFWQIKSIGKYSDSVGIITAIKEGFLPKIKKNLARSYEIDKTYCDYTPVYANCMYLYNLPWPMKNKKKALKYYREFAEQTNWSFDSHVEYTFAARFLLSLKGKEHKVEAKKLLEITLEKHKQYKYYNELAKDLMAKLEK